MKMKTAVCYALCAALVIVFGSAAMAQAAQKPTLIGFAEMAAKMEKEIGPVLDMKLTMHSGEALYRTDIVAKNEKIRVRTNALTGKEIERSHPRKLWGEQEDLATRFNLARGAKGDPIKFAEMAARLEKEIGPILRMKMVTHKNEPLYRADILVKGEKMRVRVDALTGKEIERSSLRALWGEQEDIVTKYNLARGGKADPTAGNLHEVRITPEEARSIALKKVGGGTIKKIEFERNKGGIPVYEVKIDYGNRVHEVKIDASKGTVLRHAVDK